MLLPLIHLLFIREYGLLLMFTDRLIDQFTDIYVRDLGSSTTQNGNQVMAGSLPSPGLPRSTRWSPQ